MRDAVNDSTLFLKISEARYTDTLFLYEQTSLTGVCRVTSCVVNWTRIDSTLFQRGENDTLTHFFFTSNQSDWSVCRV